MILSATSRDWVNLDLVGVKDRRLHFAVVYKTDGREKRRWPNGMISVNGSVPSKERLPKRWGFAVSTG